LKHHQHESLKTHFAKYYLGDEIKENEVGRLYRHMGAMRTAYKVLVRKPEGKTPLGRPGCKW